MTKRWSIGPLEVPGAGIAEIRTLLEFYTFESETPGWGRGRLLCDTAIEFGPNDPSGAGIVERYFERLANAFYSALDNAHRKGQVRASVNPRREAESLTALTLGAPTAGYGLVWRVAAFDFRG